ncbi:unnamed protein product [Agarophyton chilense]|eukprot:gb/GEZJ01003956.1/.p1 GENE.gb/GEZJ01003956.1/~~gb/GEZJ01003956.1/.p1  ORF type:complete len:392 (-),score=54.64 gb/GEZJ01003956.1/:100-1275(-)
MGSSAPTRKMKRRSAGGHANGATKRKRPQTASPQIQSHVLNVLTGKDTIQTDEQHSISEQATRQTSEKGDVNSPQEGIRADDTELIRATTTKTNGNRSSSVDVRSADDDGDDDEGNQSKAGNNADAPIKNESEQNAFIKLPHRKLPDPLPVEHVKKIKVTVLLENANLETVKQNGRGGGFVLLNCDDHRHLLQKTGRNANDARPDITHQCLLTLLDSPLNKEGRLKVYIRTAKNVLIDVHPETRIPRTMKRFSGLMAELLEKLKVRGTSGSTPLLKVIRNPIASHLPVGTRKIVCTYNTENVVDIRQHANSVADMVLPKRQGKSFVGTNAELTVAEHGEEVNILYVVGAMAHGKVVEDWADEYVCLSEYPLSAANVCGRIMNAYENLFGIM